ncbi:hypothetical protein O9929_17995 [Vibrio lentus]|nr:hypothetical protein [Vibrio lentus]
MKSDSYRRSALCAYRQTIVACLMDKLTRILNRQREDAITMTSCNSGCLALQSPYALTVDKWQLSELTTNCRWLLLIV